MRLAFIGFRHNHVMGLYRAALAHGDTEVVAACEEDASTAESLRRAGQVNLTHDSYQRMLAEVPCDAVAVGDCYGLRGERILAALRAGKHVISDKPICTRLTELEEIQRICRQTSLRLGCLLDLRGSASVRTARRLIGEGAIGEVHTVSFTAQHPLLYGTRPAWYFEEGLHGGTINDIAVHAIDAIPWMTGRQIASTVAARAWNARLPQHAHFQDAAQFMLELDNGGGVLGDVSYLAPDGCGYKVPQYWRMVFHGSGGMLECRADDSSVLLARNTDAATLETTPDRTTPDIPLQAFLADVAGSPAAELTTAEVLSASRIALQIQAAADNGLRDVPL